MFPQVTGTRRTVESQCLTQAWQHQEIVFVLSIHGLRWIPREPDRFPVQMKLVVVYPLVTVLTDIDVSDVIDSIPITESEYAGWRNDLLQWSRRGVILRIGDDANGKSCVFIGHGDVIGNPVDLNTIIETLRGYEDEYRYYPRLPESESEQEWETERGNTVEIVERNGKSYRWDTLADGFDGDTDAYDNWADQ
jgi:hypothetical protein